MKIAILKWDLSILNSDKFQSRSLVVTGDWHSDGPNLPLEYLRHSLDGRILLVIHPGSKPVPSLWAESGFHFMNQAVSDLRKFEGTIEENIGFLDLSLHRHRTRFASIIDPITTWALAKGFDGVLWTEFRSNISNLESGIDGIKNLIHQSSSDKQESIKSYILGTPMQIQTDYREDLQNYLENDL